MSSYVPGKDEFIERGRKSNLIPLFKEIVSDMETPVSAYKKLRSRMVGPSFLLESVEGGETWGRYSFLGFEPIATFYSRGDESTIEICGEIEVISGPDPLEVLKELMDRFSYSQLEGFEGMSGGAVGYVGYDYVRFVEKLPDDTSKCHNYPDLYFMIPSTVIVFDNLLKKLKLVKNVFLHLDDTPDVMYDRASKEIEVLVDFLEEDSVKERYFFEKYGDTSGEISLKPTIPQETMAANIDKVKEYIRAGEAIQVVISNRYKGKFWGDPFNVYRSLRVINPSPYMFFIDGGEVTVAGSSPEVLVRLKGDNVILRPIAGTRPRGRTPKEDESMESDLLADPKELAEHLMLVDLGRNDLGRVSISGSVEVNEFMIIEKYSHVMHIVSNINSLISQGLDAFDVLRATFPAGTVTGAPKVRAMELIEEFEIEKRGIYAGAVGYFDFSSNMDFCIAIRTLLFHEGDVIVQAGAGIVFDSDSEREIIEIENKAKAMNEAITWGMSHDPGNR